MPKIHKLADMSTGHITFTDAKLLTKWADHDEDGPLLVSLKDEYGWYIPIPPKEEFVEKAGHLRKEGASEAMVHLLESLSNDGFMVLCLDRDGERYPEFPSFNW